MVRQQRERLPAQALFIAGTEACERFSFYGMRAIFVPFLIAHLGMAAHIAESYGHYFNTAVYFMPLLGGWLADRWLGKYRTILYIAFFYCVGHATIALWDSGWGLVLGCALIALGAGGIKPCVSAYVGEQFTDANEHLLNRAFSLFYAAINVGATAGMFITPLLLARRGPALAFGVPGVLMAAATLVFWLGRKRYRTLPPTGASPHSFARVMRTALARGGLERARAEHPDEAIDAARAVLRIVAIFFPVLAFWTLFDQQSTTWTVQAGRMDLHLFSVDWQAAQVQNLNSAMVLVFIPLFTYCVYPLAERLGLRPTPLRKMTLGMFLTALSFAALAGIESALDSGAHLSVAWQAIPYAIITVAELLVSVTGLEFAFAQAPQSMKSTIMSLWFLTISAGNMLAATVLQVNRFEGPAQFVFFAALMAVAAIAFAWIARRSANRGRAALEIRDASLDDAVERGPA
jgi:POT family proton-dependent oligopeptide transporter